MTAISSTVDPFLKVQFIPCFFWPFQIASRSKFEDPLNRFPKNEGLDKPWCDPALVAKNMVSSQKRCNYHA